MQENSPTTFEDEGFLPGWGVGEKAVMQREQQIWPGSILHRKSNPETWKKMWGLLWAGKFLSFSKILPNSAWKEISSCQENCEQLEPDSQKAQKTYPPIISVFLQMGLIKGSCTSGTHWKENWPSLLFPRDQDETLAAALQRIKSVLYVERATCH